MGAQALQKAYFGATALHDLCRLTRMQNTLTDHMRVFVSGRVSVVSLNYAAQAERDDRETADKVLMILDAWHNSNGSPSELRERVQKLI